MLVLNIAALLLLIPAVIMEIAPVAVEIPAHLPHEQLAKPDDGHLTSTLISSINNTGLPDISGQSVHNIDNYPKDRNSLHPILPGNVVSIKAPIDDAAADKTATHAANAGNVPKNKFVFILSFLPAFFVTIWTLSALAIFTRSVLYNAYLIYVRRSAEKTDQRYSDMSKKIAEEFGVTAISVLRHDSIDGTLITGLFKPVVIHPGGAFEEIMINRDVLIHEYIHFIRKDHIWNLLAQIVRTLIPVQPVLRILCSQMNEACDFLCDDYVVHHTGDAHKYGMNLISIAHFRLTGVSALDAGVNFLSRKSSLQNRIERLVSGTPAVFHVRKRDYISASAFSLLALCASFLVGFSIKSDVGKAMLNTPVANSVIESTQIAANVARLALTADPFTRLLASRRKSEKPDIQACSLKHLDTSQVKESSMSLIDESSMRETFSHAGPVGSMRNHSIPAESFESVKQQSAYACTESKIEYEADRYFDSLIPDEEPVVFPLMDAVQANSASNDPALWVLKVIPPDEVEVQDINDTVALKHNLLLRSLAESKQHPVWSPDGRIISFTDNRYAIWIVPSEGGTPELVYDIFGKQGFNGDIQSAQLKTLCFRANGEEIVFMEEKRGQDGNNVQNVKSVNIETGEIKTLIQNSSLCRWSRDGNYLAYTSLFTSEAGFLNCINTRQMKSVHVEHQNPNSACFSPDNGGLFLTTDIETGVLYYYEMTSQYSSVSARYVIEGLQEVVDCFPDGRAILYVHSDGESTRLKLFDMDTGKSEDIIPQLTADTLNSSLSPDGTMISFNVAAKSTAGTSPDIYIRDLRYDSAAYQDTSLETEDDTPTEFALHNAMPNPFNTSTTISYSIPVKSDATLAIFNMSDQKVRELTAGSLSPGHHSFVWNGRDDDGNTVSAGVYLYRLSAAGMSANGKATLLK